MDFLLCDEISSEPTSTSPGFDDLGLDGLRSYEDPNLVGDLRVLRNVLGKSSLVRPADYFGYQKEITPSMRKIVTDWMLEVCEEEGSHGEVFHLAVNYLDRFLSSVKDIKKTQFQLLASACIFLASKFKETNPIIADKLAIYTDFAFSSQEITDWELLVLSVLGWDLSVVTSFTILDQILRRIRGVECGSFDMKSVRRHAETFLALAATEYDFYLSFSNRPSVLAVGSLIAAFSGLAPSGSIMADIASDLCELTNTNPNEAYDCGQFIEITAKRITEASNNVSTHQQRHGRCSSSKDAKESSPSTTPTDLMDVSQGLVC